MATRLYLPITTGPGITCTLLPSGWAVGDVGGLTRVLSPVPTSTVLNGLTVAEAVVTVQNIVIHRAISPALAPQSLGGTFSAVQRVLESSATADFSFQVGLYVITEDGATLQATLYGGHTATLNTTTGALGQEFGTTSATRIIPSGTALSSYTCARGERLMAMVGYRAHNTSATSFSSTSRFGDNAGSDFALTSGLTTDLNPWIELSQDIAFAGTPPRHRPQYRR